ncbi:MAG: ABC transporter permease [Burkholderiales bacterium]
MGRQQIATLARFTLLEAWRTRLLWLFVITLAIVWCGAYFAQQLAITESTRIHITLTAAASRMVSVFVLSLYILTTLVRELNDKGLELTLSFDLRRADYILGRLLGFALIALLMALVAGALQWMLAPLSAVLQWTASLTLELLLVAAMSLFCVLTFTQLMPAASFVAGFYLLSRAMASIQLISAAPIIDDKSLSHQAIVWTIDLLALVLPAMDRFTQSGWLADGAAGWPAVGACAAQAVVYTALLVAAAMFDFYRRNL